MSKLLLFPKAAPIHILEPIDTFQHVITVTVGSDIYCLTIYATVERATGLLQDQSTGKASPDFERYREWEINNSLPDQSRYPDVDRMEPSSYLQELSCFRTPDGVINVIPAVETARGDHRKMKYFSIDTENHITVHASRTAALAGGALIFSTQEQFADVIGPDSKRLLEIWNTLPGSRVVTRFTNRRVASERNWKAILKLAQNAGTPPRILNGSVPEMTQAIAQPDVGEAQTLTPPEPEWKVSPGAHAPGVATIATLESRKTVDTSQEHARPVKVTQVSKAEQAIAMMKRPGGATLKQLMETLDWQAHTVRGFVSGTLAKKMGLTVASTKRLGGERTYSITL